MPALAAMSAPEFYTRVARLYDALARRGPGVDTLRRTLADALAPAPGATVVEFGCGTAANRPYLEERVGPDGSYVGVDFAPGVLRVARERGLARGAAGHLVRGDATRPPLRADAVDACCGAFVAGMLAEPAAAVREWAALVGSGGRIGLLDLARTSRRGWRALNPAFRLFVRAGSPPGTAGALDRSPAAVQDERVAAAHRALRAVCTGVDYRTVLGGFGRVSAGTVE
ncbi:class I SAM-dependent methyltransferase [Halobaculum litoreum]|uniref:Class I SAM-dependent methyltransferase n=1 Tax=Halobaculum litoreum TaxID=3031998 RepID=A0ABD5XRI4_9EURY